ncbi:hypothetical protein [Oligoflexus tunisiensis]|uniref:hypothetical protein n=1 Tax=Oligoflexus tunisiensis TaxID=708132 RepID=UPI00114D1482|nr:hypothetical protein [Oligoflexus tunisiensis]
MRPAQVLTINPKSLSPEKRDSLQATQRFLRHTFRKILVEQASVDIFEEPLFVEDPHIYATWSTQSCLLGAGFKIGARIQFDTQDGRALQELHGKLAPDVTDEQLVVQMQETTDQILVHLQRHCQAAGLITGISQASLSKAFSKSQRPSYQLLGGAVDSWLLRIQDAVFYCTTHVIFDESSDLELLSQSLATGHG